MLTLWPLPLAGPYRCISWDFPLLLLKLPCEALVFTSLLLTTSVQKITQFSMISLWKLFSLPYLRKTVKNFPEKPFVSYLRMKRNFCELIFPWKCPWPIPQRNFFSTKILSNIN